MNPTSPFEQVNDRLASQAIRYVWGIDDAQSKLGKREPSTLLDVPANTANAIASLSDWAPAADVFSTVFQILALNILTPTYQYHEAQDHDPECVIAHERNLDEYGDGPECNHAGRHSRPQCQPTCLLTA